MCILKMSIFIPITPRLNYYDKTHSQCAIISLNKSCNWINANILAKNVLLSYDYYAFFFKSYWLHNDWGAAICYYIRHAINFGLIHPRVIKVVKSLLVKVTCSIWNFLLWTINIFSENAIHKQIPSLVNMHY